MELTREQIALLLECMELAQHHYADEDLDPGYRDLHARLTRELGARTAPPYTTKAEATRELFGGSEA
jgi:hypothetical protein